MKLTSAATIASLGEDNDAEKSLPPRTKRVPRRNTAVMKKKSLRHLPPMKEEVRKIGSRKVGQSLKRLLEGIDPVRELMIARQNSTPIQSQCDAVVASLGGEIETSRHLSSKFAAWAGGLTALERLVQDSRAF